MELFKNIFINRKLIMSLARNDFKTRFAGSFLGIIWAFVQPVVTILVYWFIFTVGFKSGQDMDVPFVLYLVAGLIPWFFFSEALNGGSSSLLDYSFLVKKVVFQIDIIPCVKIFSAFFVHVFFVGFTLILAVCYGYIPSLHWLQLLYYLICTFVFTLGLSLFTSAIECFFRDMRQIINIVLQIGVWTVPIMWSITAISPKHYWIFEINPIYYIVDGYRDAIYNHQWFFEKPGLTLYFWAITAAVLIIGTIVFKKLKPHFADVL